MVWAARCVLRQKRNNNNTNLNNYNRDSALRARTPNNKNPYNYIRVSALRARTPNYDNLALYDDRTLVIIITIYECIFVMSEFRTVGGA